MKLLMIGHLLGDFYLQSNKVAVGKKTSGKVLFWHGIMYGIIIYVVICLMTGGLVDSLLPALLIGVLHYLVDFIKIKIENSWEVAAKYGCWIFLLDQVLHILILWIVRTLMIESQPMTWVPAVFSPIVMFCKEYIKYAIAALLCGKPAAIFVSLVFGAIPETIEKADERPNKKNKVKDEKSDEKKPNPEGVKIGSWIGILEREIILLLGVLGQYGAIGFVLTAKSLARYKQFENKAFAEKYLVGTLLSSLIALGCMVISKNGI